MAAAENFASKAKGKRRQSEDPIKHCRVLSSSTHRNRRKYFGCYVAQTSLLRTADFHRLLWETLLENYISTQHCGFRSEQKKYILTHIFQVKLPSRINTSLIDHHYIIQMQGSSACSNRSARTAVASNSSNTFTSLQLKGTLSCFVRLTKALPSTLQVLSALQQGEAWPILI